MMFNNKLDFQVHRWNVHLFTLDGWVEDRLHNGCKVQKMSGTQAKHGNPMYQVIHSLAQVGRFSEHFRLWQDRVRFLAYISHSGRIEWSHNVIRNVSSNGWKKQIGFIVNNITYHLLRDRCSNFEMHGLVLLA